MHLVCLSCLPIVTFVLLLLHCRRPTPRSRVCNRRPFLSRYRLTRQCPRRFRHCRSCTNPTRHSLSRLSLPCSIPSMLPSTFQSYPNAVAGIAWDATDRETPLKAASRQRFTDTSAIKIRAILANAELFLTRCSRPRDLWVFFVFAWLGSEEAEKVRRLHVADTVASYKNFRDRLIALFGRFEFEGAYRATLRGLRQSGSESVAAYAARTTDLCSHAYAEFSPEAQLSLAVDHFIGLLADSSSRKYLQRDQAQRTLEWLETVRIAQASEASRLSNFAPTAAAASAAHDLRSPSTSFASRDQSNFVNSGTRIRKSQSTSRSRKTRRKQPANSNSSNQFAQ